MAHEHNGEDAVFTESVLAMTEHDEPEPFPEADDPLEGDLFADLPEMDLTADGGDLDDLVAPPGAVATVGIDEPLAARVARLEAAARDLAAAEVTREQRRVQRKVGAATTGAGAIGFLPILLQLAGAIDLPPALAATASTVAAIVGAFAAGWATPERTPPLPPSSAHTLLGLGRR